MNIIQKEIVYQEKMLKELKEKGVEAQFIDEPDAFQYRECMMKHNQYDLYNE